MKPIEVQKLDKKERCPYCKVKSTADGIGIVVCDLSNEQTEKFIPNLVLTREDDICALEDWKQCSFVQV